VPGTSPLTSHETYYMAEGKSCARSTSVVLRVDTASGQSGWGEVCPIPHYLPAYANGVVPAMGEMAGRIARSRFCQSRSGHGPALDAWLQGHVYAKSALDIALWDLFGKELGVPLHALLGGRRAETMPLYHSITCMAPDDMARIAREAQAIRHPPVPGEARRRQ
jgi:L-alanine-DL-glutamate epimerase-like enolase superfamily enzyme